MKWIQELGILSIFSCMYVCMCVYIYMYIYWKAYFIALMFHLWKAFSCVLLCNFFKYTSLLKQNNLLSKYVWVSLWYWKTTKKQHLCDQQTALLGIVCFMLPPAGEKYAVHPICTLTEHFSRNTCAIKCNPIQQLWHKFYFFFFFLRGLYIFSFCWHYEKDDTSTFCLLLMS